MEEHSTSFEILSESKKADYSDLLWRHVEYLSELKNPLTQHQMELYQEVAAMRNHHLNLYEQELLAKKETEYWRISEKLQDIKDQEDQLIQTLQNLEAGIIDEEVIQKLVPQTQETGHISKKKRRILEEKERLGIDPREIAWDMYREFGSNQTRLTTGRHRKQVKGSFDPTSAADEFFYRTADTHGGKVSHGKKSGYFTTISGKKIRKV